MATPNTQSTVLDAFGVELLSAIHKIREPVSFAAGERIFEQDSTGDEFYIITRAGADRGADAGRRYRSGARGAVAGDFLGEEALLGGSAHWASAVANTDVRACASRFGLRKLYKESPRMVSRCCGRWAATPPTGCVTRLRVSPRRWQTMRPIPTSRNGGARGRGAARVREWAEERVDALLEDIATIDGAAEELAQATVAETTSATPTTRS